jgi:hypothetical protein
VLFHLAAGSYGNDALISEIIPHRQDKNGFPDHSPQKDSPPGGFHIKLILVAVRTGELQWVKKANF